MENSKTTTTGSPLVSGQFIECKYCREKFYPEIVHDLHVLSAHGNEWAVAPCYAEAGIFSLATNDILKIVHREFSSLASVTYDDLRKSAPRYEIIDLEPVTPDAAITSRKRRFEDDGDRSEPTGKLMPPGKSNGGKRARLESSTSIGTHYSDSTTVSKSRTESRSDGEISESSLGSDGRQESNGDRRRDITTTYVARSVHVSRRARLQLAGKPYYYQDHRDQRHDPHRSDRPTKEVHAFRCFPKKYSANETAGGAVYVFQASDVGDLLRNLTFKVSKLLRQKRQETNNDKNIAEKAIGNGQNEERPRFVGRSRFWNRVHHERQHDDRMDMQNEAAFRNRWYNRRIDRTRVYDAGMKKIQAGSDACCVIKNSLHLYLFQSPAGERAPTLNEAVFSRKDVQGQATLSGRVDKK